MPGAMLLWRLILMQMASTFAAALGALQIAALRNGLEGLAWPIGLRHKRLGYSLAGLLMTIAFVGGVLLALANAPLPVLLLVVVFLTGSGLALLMSIVGAAMRLEWTQQHQRTPLCQQGRRVELGPLRVTFYQPTGQGPFLGLCLLPDPSAPDDDLTMLLQALLEGGIAVLAFDWRSLDNPDRLTLQGLVAVGISHLARWPETDAERVGLVGIGLGGDLALRNAAMDSGVAVVLAIEPVLSTQRPGAELEALHALSWFEAQRRASRWQNSALVNELDALTAIRHIDPRPVAIVVGCAGDADVIENLEILRTEGGCSLIPATHTKAMRCATEWLMEHLA